MKTRSATKKELKKLNKKAVDAGANALTEAEAPKELHRGITLRLSALGLYQQITKWFLSGDPHWRAEAERFRAGDDKFFDRSSSLGHQADSSFAAASFDHVRVCIRKLCKSRRVVVVCPKVNHPYEQIGRLIRQACHSQYGSIWECEL